MRENRDKREGFSLIEMIIAIAIVGIVMSAVLVLLSYATGMMRRTNNTVSLQNQSKDAMLHITTHLQESSEATWDDTNHVLTMAKIRKNDDGSPKNIVVGYYWVDSSLLAAGGGEKTEADEADRGTGGLVFYCEHQYPESDTDDVANYLELDGSVDFTKIALSDSLRSTSEADASHTFIRNVTGFNCDVLERIDDASLPISGKTVRVQLALVDASGDATFNNVKDVYLRNQ